MARNHTIEDDDGAIIVKVTTEPADTLRPARITRLVIEAPEGVLPRHLLMLTDIGLPLPVATETSNGAVRHAPAQQHQLAAARPAPVADGSGIPVPRKWEPTKAVNAKAETGSYPPGSSATRWPADFQDVAARLTYIPRDIAEH